MYSKLPGPKKTNLRLTSFMEDGFTRPKPAVGWCSRRCQPPHSKHPGTWLPSTVDPGASNHPQTVGM